ncbi:hypothetical protein KM176_13015 [Pseudooceanicola sp. CBS1P-1]|uniref:DUF6473 domain-containing protein n=1 Tax=Pseudooceanicola albus TaxID=2692189 RepID=A0A6L7G3G3_9RHOB|nr:MULTISPECIES: DUF6473 family protein [Pseudooceanicola]MBT9384783.1 hypothetical protein [Pseudooceanicola endophyticus]MXN18222.1 hypothetical protein [Pseudooceanicola albus]
MGFEPEGTAGLDYFPCRYGAAQGLFRGPGRSVTGAYLAFLGGINTFGRFIPQPYPALLESRLGLPCVNLARAQAGPEALLADPGLMRLAAGARAVVLELPGAANLSNRFYDVHPRRNDRVVRVHPLLRRLFPEVDVAEIHFTGHLLGRLRAAAPERFDHLAEALRSVWCARMEALLRALPGPVLLLWLADHAPCAQPVEWARAPALLTRAVIEALEPHAAGLIRAVPGGGAAADTAGMVFSRSEAALTAHVLPVAAHQEAARQLEAPLRRLLSADRLRA